MRSFAAVLLVALVLAVGAPALAGPIPKNPNCAAYEGIRKDASGDWECYPTAAVTRVMVDQQTGADACVQIQAAIDAANGGGIVDARNLSAVESCSGLDLCDVHSVTVLLGPTRFNVTQPIYITGSSSVNFIGTGASHQEGHDYGTVFAWASSDPNEAMFNIHLSRELRFEGLRVQAESQNLFAGFRMVAAAPSGSTCQATETTTNNTFENVTVMGQNNSGEWTLDRGFFWDDCGDPQDPTAEGTCSFNNDGTALRDVSVSNYSNAAYYITGFNSKSHTFYDCGFQGKNHLTTVDPGDYGIYLRSGSFRWYGGAGMGGGNEEADFYLMKNTDTILISGANLEKSERLLQTGFSTSPWAVTVEGVRWASDRMGSGNYAVDYQKHGTLTLTGNLIGSDPAKALVMRVKGRAIAIGNHITSSAGTASQGYRDLFTILGNVGASWTLLDNVIRNSGGSASIANKLEVDGEFRIPVVDTLEALEHGEIVIDSEDAAFPRFCMGVSGMTRCIETTCVMAEEDLDSDCVPNSIDNCTWIYNPSQTDADDDGVGDTCECLADADCDDGLSCSTDLCIFDFGQTPGQCRNLTGNCP